MPPTLFEVEQFARQAGEILRASYGHQQTIYRKGLIDLVTDVDHRSEAFLLAEIKRRYPDDSIIAEESGSAPGRSCCRWYIDPLDGTVNFAHGVPIFTVSIAYAENGGVRLGAVYDPMREECFSAELGRGAWLNGNTIHASNPHSLDESLLVTGFPYDIRTNPENNLDLYARFALCSQGVRRLGSAALDLAYVACGRLDGYWETQIKPWDVAAGVLIAREAGACVTNLWGDGDALVEPCTILAASSHLHALMLEVIQDMKRSRIP